MLTSHSKHLHILCQSHFEASDTDIIDDDSQ